MLLWTGCDNPLCGISSRKLELLKALTDDPAATNSELAKRAHMSESTVKKHLREIYQAVGAQNRSECLVLLVKKGLVVGDGEGITTLPKRSDYV